MLLQNVKIRNVKSYKKEIDVKFKTGINILIGANGSGKSNLLDIITLCIRNFFFKGIQINESNDAEGFHQGISYSTNIGNNITSVLQKHYDCTDAMLVEFSFYLTDKDIETMTKIKKNYSKLLEEQKKYKTCPQIHFVNQWDIELLKSSNRIYKFRIQNTSLINNHDTKHRMVLNYMNNYDLFTLLTRGKEYAINTNYTYFSPYRVFGVSNNQVTLTGQSYLQSLSNTYNITSRKHSTFIQVASLYFAEKMRNYEVEASLEGYKSKWENDNEVKVVSKYLSKVGYSWELILKNRNKNIYEIKLKKNDEEYMLIDASSGEKEIINFLLGIFSLGIYNGIVIIDEPELHLHPKWQKILLEMLYEISEVNHCQIIITTHSGSFINEKSYKNISRVYCDSDSSSNIVMFEDVDILTIKDILNIINASNNEKIFFADCIIMVEGITDKLIISRILDEVIEDVSFEKIIEVVEIKGKHNLDKYISLLKILKIPYAFITDLDYVNTIEGSDLKGLFTVNTSKIYSDVIKNIKSYDGERLINELEVAIESNDIDELSKLWSYIKSIRRKLKTDITEKENAKLTEAICEQELNNIYILGLGEIEQYFPSSYQRKELLNVVKLLDESEYQNWKLSDGYDLLLNIIKKIVASF